MSSKRHYNYYQQLKEKYPYEMIKNLEVFKNDQSLMEWTRARNIRFKNFFEIVLPSLCSKYYDQEDLFKNIILNPPYDPDNQKFLCMFDTCIYTTNFASRQTLIRHLLNIHCEEIPVRGVFLSNTSKSSIGSLNSDESNINKTKTIKEQQEGNDK